MRKLLLTLVIGLTISSCSEPNVERKVYTEGGREIQEMVNFERSPQLSLYSKIEYLIIMWSNDGTKTAGTLTRQIMELLKNK